MKELHRKELLEELNRKGPLEELDSKGTYPLRFDRGAYQSKKQDQEHFKKLDRKELLEELDRKKIMRELDRKKLLVELDCKGTYRLRVDGGAYQSKKQDQEYFKGLDRKKATGGAGQEGHTTRSTCPSTWRRWSRGMLGSGMESPSMDWRTGRSLSRRSRSSPNPAMA